MNAARPQFFKVLLPGFSDKLLIPHEFTKHLANLDHCRKATILSPLGKCWHVDLLKCNDSNLYFTTGWKAFTQAHDFIVGLFLVFRYEGNMVFTIKVFDLNGCLKEYNYYPIRYSDQNIDNVSKKRDKEEDDTDCDAIEVKQEMLSEIPQHPLWEKSKQPAEFHKIIKPYNLNYNKMCVPKRFCTYHGLIDKQRITLKDSKGRSWLIEFHPGTKENHLRNGWEEFSKANNLKLGDRCIFQFISKSEMFVKVVKCRKL